MLRTIKKYVWFGVSIAVAKIGLWLLRRVGARGAVSIPIIPPKMSQQTQLTPPVKNPTMEKAERKLEVERMLVKVKAVLLKDVSFKTYSGVTHLDEGTEISLDPEENVGYYDGHHFDVKKDEYKIAYLN